MKAKQQKLFKEKFNNSYGGELRKKAKNRGFRPLSSKDSIHVVLRSSQAKGEWSFRAGNNATKLKTFIEKMSNKYGVKILSAANVGNHLHLHVRIPNRTLYKSWIRGLTAGIAIIITKMNKFKKLQTRFWDYRPFTRVVQSFKAMLNLKDYIEINQFEGLGMPRTKAVLLVKGSRAFFKSTG
jgi:REP element-mobilizing transposase RayT